MTKWIDCLREYNRNQRVWCTPRKGTRSYAKVMQCVSGDKNAFVKKKKLKVVEKFEDEKARDIQENPDIVVQMKRATINDVPDAVMNNIMGQFLDVKDKANLASVGVKVKMTDKEAKEAERKSYNYSVYMELIDRYKDYYKNFKIFNNKFKKIPEPDENEKSYFMWNYGRMWDDQYVNGLYKIKRHFRMGVKKKKSEKNKILEIDFDKDELTFYDTKDNKTYTTNQEIYNLMNLPHLSKKLQQKEIFEIDKSLSYREGYEKNSLDLLKNIKKPLYTKEKIEKIMRFAVIYSSGNLLNKNIKLNYNNDYINKNLILKTEEHPNNNPRWNNLIENTYGRERVILRDKLLVYSGKYREWKTDYYISWRKISWNSSIITIFNMNHSKDPFNENVINKMEEDVKTIRNNYRDGSDGEYYSTHDHDTIKLFKKYIDDNKTNYEDRKREY